jgi:hypothetical protein
MEAAKKKYFSTPGATEKGWESYKSSLSTTELGAGLNAGKLWDSAMLWSDTACTKAWPYGTNFTFTEENIGMLNRADRYQPYGAVVNGAKFYIKDEDAERILTKFGKTFLPQLPPDKDPPYDTKNEPGADVVVLVEDSNDATR